jgi:hypothetical protein
MFTKKLKLHNPLKNMILVPHNFFPINLEGEVSNPLFICVAVSLSALSFNNCLERYENCVSRTLLFCSQKITLSD